MKVFVGSKKILEHTPKLIELSNEKCILHVDTDGNPKLYSADCPHQHGIVEELSSQVFRCPSHGWTYEPSSGRSINAPQACLRSYKIFLEDDKLFAEIPSKKKKLSIDHPGPKIAPKITLVSNACLLIEWQGFNLLTDPWIEGPAIFGAWEKYPPSGISVNDLPKIDAIWISHEHTDHFNPYTLEFLQKEIPVYVPDFNNGRLAQKLEKLGFSNVISVKSMQQISLTDDIHAVSFESESMWKDTIIYLQFGNFKILNVNDAGFNWKIIDMIEDVDLVCSAFSYGASAYPLNWTDLDVPSKRNIMIAKNSGMLKMIKQIVELCNAKYFIPFANFNELRAKQHEQLVEFQIKNTPKTVKDYFKNSDVQVLDLIPGDIWNGEDNHVIRKNKIDRLFERKNIHNYLKKNCYAKNQDEFIPSLFDIKEIDIKKYFEQLSGSKLTNAVGDYKIQFTASNEQREISALIEFSNGVVVYHANTSSKDVDLSMSCPGAIVQNIITNNLSWDEIYYWSTFSKGRDAYNIAFWKLLHTPWEAQGNSSNKLLIKNEIENRISIATILENGGDEALKVMEKHGLFCGSCDAALGETVEDGCKSHGLDKQKSESLVFELEQILKKREKK